MIQATFKKDEDSNALVMTVKGHAGQNKKGHDLVCASASILAYTVAQTIKYIHAQGGLKKKPRIELNDGDALIVCKPKEEYYAEALHTFFVAEVGFSLLANNYPQYVELDMFGKA